MPTCRTCDGPWGAAVIDVLVVGGGPVGLATALHAARAGMDVAVAEPRAGPIDRACGEGLMPGAVTALAGLGVDVAGHPLRGIRYLGGGRAAEATFRTGFGAGVRRTRLHAALLAAVHRAGVPVLPLRVTGLRQDADRVVADGVAARYLVGADGLHSRVRRATGLDARPHRWPPAPWRDGPRRYGLRRHFAVRPWTDLVEVYWSRHAEAYVTPVATDLVNVAVLGPAGRYDLAAFPALAARLPAGAADATHGRGPLRQRSRGRVAGRVLLVGDAAGYVDALTGEGVAVGLAQARAAVHCLAAGRPADYDHAWRAVTRRYRWLTEALVRGTANPRAASLVVPAAAALPGAFAAAVNAIARG